ncbi:family 43 glycosylhydrolase [Bowmanella denitrificans]|uniref:family 43 glycosylhydrolase n=1 Tax=Bowmanella denitrificans TaxID=366582 RepID=UPI000C9C1449|nr:family 43 glycosylhydrolase [Bowmanella denitrificans]
MNNLVKSLRCLLPVIALAMAACSSTSNQIVQADKPAIQVPGSFTNPLFPNGADPWLEYWDGNYYLTTTTWTSELVMRKSPTLEGLADATPVNIWSDTDPKRCCNFWAFEFHRLQGPNGYRWYMMYTAGQDGSLDHQHLNVLESAGDDPMGPYEYKGALMPDVWNIDGNYLVHNNKLYVIYSQWQGDEQLNIIAEMDTPWSLKPGTPHTILTRPELDWEISGRKVTEGAEILQRHGRTFMTYSASFCNTPDYKLGLMELVGDDPLNRQHWKKYPEPVFSRTDTVFGPGHNGFFRSPDGSEEWLVYHGNDSVEHGCSATRSLRAQKFTWNEDGTPNFGTPLTPGVVVSPPSGEDGPLVTRVQGQAYQLINATSELCLDIASDPQDSRALQANCRGNNGRWILDPTTDGYYRLANGESSKFLELANCTATNNARIQEAAWRNNACQQWSLEAGQDGHTQIKNRHTGLALGVAGCSAAANQAVLQQSDSACNQWRLQPMGEVVLLSQQSGKTIAVSSNQAGANVQQAAWTHGDNQRWTFKHTDTGYFQIKPQNAPSLCLATEADAVVPGANLQLADCAAKTAQWRLTPKQGGGVALENRYSRQLINLANCGLAEGTNLAQGPKLENRCQVFHLRQPD